MKNFLLSIALTILFLSHTLSQVTFEKTYGGSYADYGNSVAQTSDHGFIIAGTTKSFGNPNGDLYLLKTDSMGGLLWYKTFQGMNAAEGEALDITNDGGYIIVGNTSPNIIYSVIYLIRTNSDGDTLWTKTYGNQNDGDAAFDVKQVPDGGFVITGSAMGVGGRDILVMKTDSFGALTWSKKYDSYSTDDGLSIINTSDQGFFIVGSNGTVDACLLRLDSNGDTLWTKKYGGTGADWAYSSVQTPDSGFIITGYTTSYSNGEAVYLIRTLPDGIPFGLKHL